MPTTQVLDVLKAHGVDSYPQRQNENMTVLTGKGQTLAFALGAVVSKHLVGKLAQKFQVPVRFFYRPELLSGR